MSYKIDEIEGIGPAYAEKLAATGVATTSQLLSKAATPKGRDAVAAKSGISKALILKWANMADLMRITGVGGEYAELLEAAGVDTIKELRNRNPANTALKMSEINADKKLTRKVPTEKTVSGWIEQACKITPAISH